MWFQPLADLTAAPRAKSFLICRWREFFDSGTPDTYQPRIFHLPVLVQEIADAARAVQKEPYLRAHFSQIQQECRSRIVAEKAVHLLCQQDDLEALDTIAAENADPAAISAEAERLLQSGFADRYEAAALEAGVVELNILLSNAVPRLRSADRWLGLWSTIALHRRYPISDSYVSWCKDSLTLSLEENIASIASGIAQRPSRYSCVLSVIARRSLNDAGLPAEETAECVTQLKTVMNAANIPTVHHSLLPGYERQQDELLLMTTEEGVSATDALHQSVRRIRPLLNLLGFYRGAAPARPIQRGWAGATTEKLSSVEITRAEMGDIRPRRNATRLTKIAVRAAAVGRLDGPIANALELHNMALASPDPRVRFLTMWSALECLASTTTGESVITRVMNMTVPIITWRRLEKQIRYLGRDLLEWRKLSGDNGVELACLPNATPHEVPSEDVLMAVTRAKDHPHIVELLGAVSRHALLTWRVTTTWEIFHDASALSKDLRGSSERLTWHLGRIYRMRNRLAHAGDDSALVAPLLNNLQFYLSTTISRLLHVVTLQPSHDAASAVVYWSDLSKAVIDGLALSPGVLTVKDLLPNPRLMRDHRPWGD